jgi:hypothetical protein
LRDVRLFAVVVPNDAGVGDDVDHPGDLKTKRRVGLRTGERVGLRLLVVFAPDDQLVGDDDEVHVGFAESAAEPLDVGVSLAVLVDAVLHPPPGDLL